YAAEAARVDLAEADGLRLEKLLEDHAVLAVLAGGHADRRDGLRDGGVAEHVVGAGGLFHPVGIELGQALGVHDGLADVPDLVRVHHEPAPAAQDLAGDARAPHVVFDVPADVMSTRSFHTGFPSAFAQRSHTAFTTAAVARCIAPFSGPIQRSWLSPVMSRQNAPMSRAISSSVLPTMSGRSALAAATTTSFPRPVVNVSPWPASPSPRSVRRTTYVAE